MATFDATSKGCEQRSTMRKLGGLFVDDTISVPIDRRAPDRVANCRPTGRDNEGGGAGAL
jgi:hypothetical protein